MSNFEWSHVMDQLHRSTQQLNRNTPDNQAIKGEQAIVNNYNCLNKIRDDINKIEKHYTKCLAHARSEDHIINCIHQTTENIAKTRFGLIDPNHRCGPVLQPTVVEKVTHSATNCISSTHSGSGVKGCVHNIKKNIKHTSTGSSHHTSGSHHTTKSHETKHK
jgi:hypothetical protein